jgi:glycosyltransferase involved in cell wall biosynthesis
VQIAINGRFLGQKITGVQRVCREFVNALDRMLAAGELPGVAARILIPAREPIEDPDYGAIRVERVGRWRGYAWEQFELPKVAGKDILLSLANVAPVSRLLMRGRSNVVLVHDLSYAHFPSAYSLAFRAAYSVLMAVAMRRAGAVVTVSESERAAILKHFRHVRGLKQRLFAAPNGAALSGGQSSAAGTPREDFGLYVGSFSKRKNIAGAVEAAIRLAREHNMKFVFVGGAGAIFADAAIAIPEDVAGNIAYLGQVDDTARIADLYRRAAVLVFPSHYESSGLPATEAMLFGCPVVAARIPALVERCGDAAEYCDPADVGSIVAAVRRVAGDAARASELSRAGYQRAAMFSWEGQVKGVLAAAAKLDRAG